MNEKDDFWNIDRILPKSKGSVKSIKSVNTVEVSTHTKAGASDVDIRALFSAVNERKGANSAEDLIVKENDYPYFQNSRVITFAYVGRYSNVMTYDNKARAYALRFFDLKCDKEADFVEYFSYNPSFNELNRSQLEWYVYWRESLKSGSFIKAPISYVLLYISEIVNLPDKIEPPCGLDLMISAWKNCTDSVPRYDKIITDIILEYCIVHLLPIPYDKLSDIIQRLVVPMSNVLGSLYIFDYLLSDSHKLEIEDIKFIFEKNFAYSYTTSKHYSTDEKFKNLLDKYFYSVLSEYLERDTDAIEQIFSNLELRMSPVKIIRPTFLLVNASSEVKKNIVFEYYSFDRNDVKLLYLHNVAKYIENKFRGECGIRARLNVSTISESSKAIINSILSSLFKKNDYEDADELNASKPRKTVTVNIAKAQAIEKNSWETTRMLVEGIEIFDDDEPSETVEEKSDTEILDKTELEILRSLLCGDSYMAKAECEHLGVFLDSIIISINDKLLEVIGDTVIDISNATVYDDYIEELTEMFIKEE